MSNTDKTIIEKLKAIIDKQGPKYLADRPIEVYNELASEEPQQVVMAGAIVMLLVSGLWNECKPIKDAQRISQEIQKRCCFNKKMSDRLASVVVGLYSDQNQSEWKAKTNEGLMEFFGKKHTFRWEGFCVWDAGNGTVDCIYDADVVLKPVKGLKNNQDLQSKLKENPFLSSNEIYKLFDEELCGYLNSAFEECCTCDDYYQPVVEDFELEYHATEWCKKNGFELVSCEGTGRDEGYEPKFTRGWY